MTRLTARYATALVFVFGVAGVFTYAQDLTKPTLAGPSKELEPPVLGCPKDYPIETRVKLGHPIDANGDGIICATPEGDEFVDNGGSGGGSDPSGTRHVTGHGNFFDSDSKIGGTSQDISFSFHGIGIDGGNGAAAKGKFEYHDQTPGGADLTVHGDVVCLTVVDNTATLLGIITRSNDAGLAVDDVVIWKAQDNGEGNNVLDADRVTRLAGAGKVIPAECKFGLPKLAFREIVGGNIQVDEDETAGGVPTAIEEKSADDEESDSWGTSGEGKFYDTGKKAGVLQDIAFKFSATGLGASGKVIDGVATGDFDYLDQTPGSNGLSVRGLVVCASVNLKSVTLIGLVTASNDKGLPIDTLVAWKAQDNSEDGALDQISRLQPIGVKASKGALCNGKVPELKMQAVVGGEVFVK